MSFGHLGSHDHGVKGGEGPGRGERASWDQGQRRGGLEVQLQRLGRRERHPYKLGNSGGGRSGVGGGRVNVAADARKIQVVVRLC